MPLSVNAIKYVYNDAKDWDENNFCCTESLNAELLDDFLNANHLEINGAVRFHKFDDIKVYSSNLQKIINLYNKHTQARNALIEKSIAKTILHIFLKIITFSIAGLKGQVIDVGLANQKIENLAVGLRAEAIKPNQNPPQGNYVTLRDQALELKNTYAANHYLFIHGQSLQISVLTTLNKFFIKRFFPDKGKDKKHQSFRVPGTVPQINNVAAFHQKYPSLTDNIVRDEIMSVDGDFYNENRGESAYYYAKNNLNVLTNTEGVTAFRRIAYRIVGSYVQDQNLASKLAERIVTIGSHKQVESSIGALYLIAIPKEVVEDPSRNFVYRSHPYGHPCHCHSSHDIDSHESLTNGTMPYCNNNYRQYRILTARLIEEPGVKVHRFTAIPRDIRVAYRELIHRTGLEIALCQNLEKVTTNPSKELWDQIFKDVGELLERYQKAQSFLFAEAMAPLFFPLLQNALVKQGHLLDDQKRVMLASCLDEGK